MVVTEKTYRRAELASMGGLLMQTLGVVLVLLLGAASRSPAVSFESWHWLGGIPVWILLWVFFYQKRVESVEHVELDELRRQREQTGQSALFEVEAEDLLVAGRRLRTINRYVLPAVTILLAAYHIGIGVWLWAIAQAKAPFDIERVMEIQNARVAMALLAGLAVFPSFVLSRLVMGIAKDPARRMLRAGGNYLTGNCFVSLVLVVVLGVADFGFRMPELVVAWAIPVLLVVLGIEMVLNLVLEMYRPRMPGSEPRPAIESRLLGLISEPGDVARSIAEAMNYQFGFEISKTWFYQLLQKALGPLVLFQLFSLLALTAFVIVEPGQQAIIERFGQFRGQQIAPGLHLKLPWPIERARIVNKDQIREILLGTSVDERGNYHDEGDVVLWASQHDEHGEEYDILVAPPAEEKERVAASQSVSTHPVVERSGPQDQSVSVYLLRVVASLRYRVSDPKDYLYNYSNPDEVLSATIQEAFLRFAASRDSDQLMTAERHKVNEELRQELEAQIHRMDPPLGVELVDASLVGVHPPPAVAAAYEQVGAGELIYNQKVYAANTYATQVLTGLAGSPWLAEQIDLAIQEVGRNPDSEQARKHLADLLGRAGGEIARILNKAEADRTDSENIALADVAAFKAKLKAYRQAPRLFAAAEYLDTLARVLQPVRKYLVASPTGDRPFVVTFDMKDQEGIFGGLSTGKK